jgi:hypothetical protein
MAMIFSRVSTSQEGLGAYLLYVRKGKERKGKEGKGKERKGMERIVSLFFFFLASILLRNVAQLCGELSPKLQVSL